MNASGTRRGWRSTAQELRDAFVDNPITEKDSATGVLKAMLPAAAVLLMGTFVVVMAASTPTLDNLSRWGRGTGEARWLLGTLFGIGLWIQAIVLPIVASSSIASERESGTLPLLLTTSLGPGRIVAGKLSGLLCGSSPFLGAGVVLLSTGFLVADTNALVAAVILGVWFMHALAALSVGLAASALADNTKSAGPRALLGAMVFVWGPLTMPGTALCLAASAANIGVNLIPGAVLAAFGTGTVIAVSLLTARRVLSPRAACRPADGRRLRTMVLFGGPLLAAISLWALEPMAGASARNLLDGFSRTLALGYGGVLLLTVVASVAFASWPRQHRLAPKDATTPDREAVVGPLLFLLGGLLASPIAAHAVERLYAARAPLPIGDVALTSSDVLGGLLFGSVVLALYFGIWGGAAAVVARFTSRPLLRAAVPLIGIAGIGGLPGLVAMTLGALGFPLWGPLFWLNPFVIIGSWDPQLQFLSEPLMHEMVFGMPAHIAGLAVYAAALAAIHIGLRRGRG